jgi:hypothetical protein
LRLHSVLPPKLFLYILSNGSHQVAKAYSHIT